MLKMQVLIIISTILRGIGPAIGGGRSPKLVGGDLISQDDLEAGKFSAWSIGTYYTEAKGTCAGVLFLPLHFAIVAECKSAPGAVSLGSVSPLTSITGSAGVTEIYDVHNYVHEGAFFVLHLSPRATNPPKSKAVPANGTRTQPPAGQTCRVFGFSDGTETEIGSLNQFEVKILDMNECIRRWSGIATINPNTHLCAWVTQEGSGAVCDHDFSGPIFCKRWDSAADKFFFSKDDDDYDDEQEVDWVFSGMLRSGDGNNFQYCDNSQTLPNVFHFFRK